MTASRICSSPYWGRNHAVSQHRRRRFEDVTGRAGLLQDRARYNTGCAFLDYDNDGHLDLFVANYVEFDLATTPKPGGNPYCWYRGIPVNCGPRGLPFDRNILYHNNGDGTFTDVSERRASRSRPRATRSGSADGRFQSRRPDRISTLPATRRRRCCTSTRATARLPKKALLRGVALDENGKALSGMGVAAADYDGDGWLDIFRTNFSDERETLYRNRGDGEFEDATLAAGTGVTTPASSGGAAGFSISTMTVGRICCWSTATLSRRWTAWVSTSTTRTARFFTVMPGTARSRIFPIDPAPGILERHSARGAAFGDYDNDGSVEVLINNQNEPPSLLKLAQAPPGNWIILKLDGHAIQSERHWSPCSAYPRLGGSSSTRSAAVAAIFRRAIFACTSAWAPRLRSTAWKSIGPPEDTRSSAICPSTRCTRSGKLFCPRPTPSGDAVRQQVLPGNDLLTLGSLPGVVPPAWNALARSNGFRAGRPNYADPMPPLGCE